jgi:hypothetical protein
MESVRGSCVHARFGILAVLGVVLLLDFTFLCWGELAQQLVSDDLSQLRECQFAVHAQLFGLQPVGEVYDQTRYLVWEVGRRNAFRAEG